jgi:hypothetical protein
MLEHSMKNSTRTLLGSVALLTTVATSPVQAHSISIFQIIQTIFVGNPFLITLLADYTGTPRLQPAEPGFRASVPDPEIIVDEIGIAISWDPTVIDVIWTDTLNPPWDTTVIRPDSGVTTLFLKSSAGTQSEQFPVANMGFVARGVGTTDVIIDTSSGYCATSDCGVFYQGVEIPTEFINGKVTVVAPSEVPVPAGLWLFVSGLLALAGVIRRHAIVRQ